MNDEVESELVTDTPRRIRVYDVGGDFFLDVPEGVRLTFGYFNPKGQSFQQNDSGYGSRPSEVARATALRIYADSTDKRQIACFLGVKGFRDESIKLTKIVQKVTIESKLVDDGEGTVEYGGKQLRELSAAPEKEF
jgi:hypothetical protein